MKRAILVAVMVLGAIFGTTLAPQAASAAPVADDCGRHWPSHGWTETWTNGGYYIANYHFRLTDAELQALQCTADFLEIEFPLVGFNMPYEWEDYSVYSDTPGYTHDVAFRDHDPMPAATAIETWNLQANTDYYVQIEWHASPTQVTSPATYVNWVPSGWGEGTTYFGDYLETLSCAWGVTHYDKGWCVFPRKVKHLVADSYDGPLPFSGYQSWWVPAFSNNPTF